MSTPELIIPKTSVVAIVSLVLGIFAICVPVLLSLVAVALGVWALILISKSRGALQGNGLAITGIIAGAAWLMVLPIVIALLLPAIQAARTAVRLTNSTHELEAVGSALFSYESDHRTFPAVAGSTAAHRPQLSWRVHILPYLNHDALYRKFDLQQPWNSPTNLPLIEEMPPEYAVALSRLPRESGKTCLQIAVGQGTLFEAGDPQTLAGLVDGASNTVLLVITDEEHAVTWTAPDDYDVVAIPAGLANVAGSTLLCFFDLSVRKVRLAETDLLLWRKWATAGADD